jgi:hypothetical protein
MTVQLLPQQDLAIAAWTWKAFKLSPVYINRAFGILDNSELVGSIIFSNYNGSNLEVSYYAENMITSGIVRAMARFILEVFHVQRVTFHIKRTDRRRLAKHLVHFGAKFEACMRDYYGDGNDALQYVMFRRELIKIAGPRYARAKMH